MERKPNRLTGIQQKLWTEKSRLGAALLLVLLVAAGDRPAAAQVEIFSDGFESGDTCAWQETVDCGSDDFEDGDFDGWQVLHPEEADVSVVSGALRIEPVAFSLWFNNSTSIFVWRTVTGDFRMTSTVTARRLPPNDGDPPLGHIRLGGVMARNPDTAMGQNYVFIVLGADVDDLSVEAKTTTNSVSTFDGTPLLPSATAELRLCRLGDTFHVLFREAGGVWQPHADIPSVVRSDLPQTLQVGPMAYANRMDPDLQVFFEEVAFAPVGSVGDCSGN